MKKIKVLCVMLAVFSILYCSIPAYAVNSADEPDVEQFVVESKDTITGETYYETFDTSVTAQAMSEGITTVSTDAYIPEGMEVYELDDGIEPLSVIGDDTRHRATGTTGFPYSAVCYIRSFFDKDGNGSIDEVVPGTAFLEGPSAVVTAGHMIYDEELGGWCSYVYVTPGRNGTTAPFGVARSTTIHKSANFYDDVTDFNYDWAVVELDTPIGNQTGWFGKSWTSASLNNTTVTVIGFPNDKENGTMWWGVGSITKSLNYTIQHNCDTAKGNSGSPILNSGYQAVGINTGGGTTYNRGTRMTEWLYNYLVGFQS